MEVLHKAFLEIDVAEKVCFRERDGILMTDAASVIAATPLPVVLCICQNVGLVQK